jgi:hypothetical protein
MVRSSFDLQATFGVYEVVTMPSLVVAQQRSPSAEDFEIPSGPPVPIVRDILCQSEVCIPGTYIACERLEIADIPGPGHRVVGSLSRGDEFRVVAARAVILSTSVVHVTRDVGEVFGRPVDYQEGEFLFLLDYRGEGRYSAWRNGEIVDVEQFWPSSNFGPGSNFEYGGELIREGVTEVWYGIEGDGPELAWVPVQGKSILSPIQISRIRFFDERDPVETCPE